MVLADLGENVVDIVGNGTYDMAVPLQATPVRAILGGSRSGALIPSVP